MANEGFKQNRRRLENCTNQKQQKEVGIVHNLNYPYFELW